MAKSIMGDTLRDSFLWVKPNIFGELHNFNQSSSDETKMDCGFFSWDFWNLLYNTGFWLYERHKSSLAVEEEIRHISEGLKLWNPTTGFNTTTMEVIFNYFKNFNFWEADEMHTRDNVDLVKFPMMSGTVKVWLGLFYAVRVLIAGAPSFFSEGRTLGEIKTYQKWALNHFVNVQLAMRDINDVIKKWDYFIQDNYFWKWKYNVYKIDIDKFLSTFVIGNNWYSFILNYKATGY